MAANHSRASNVLIFAKGAQGQDDQKGCEEIALQLSRGYLGRWAWFPGGLQMPYHIALAVHIDMGPAHTLIAVTRGEDRGRAQADDQVPRPRGLHGGRHGFDRRSFQVPAGR